MLRPFFLRAMATVLMGCALVVEADSDSKVEHAVTIRQAGPPVVLYDWSEERCEDAFIPDAPVRAFRRADGQMVLIATFRVNWSLVGADFATLEPSCHPLMRSAKYPAGTGRLWIEATYTHDGQEVAALVSQDLNADLKARGCEPRGHRGRCWLNHIVAAVSTDMGRTFELLPPKERVVATLGAEYPAANIRRFGVFTTSNIVRHGNAYYMMAFAQGEGLQKAGNCLFRTEDPMEPWRWRAWDGQRFDIDMRSGAPRPCPPLANLTGEVRSLTYSVRHDRWIAVFKGRLRLPGDAKPVPGFYYAVSSDLREWGKPQRLMRAPTKPRELRPDQYWAYPSLLDPKSASRNFETIDSDHPVLLFTVAHLRNGKGTMNRDLQYIPLTIE